MLIEFRVENYKSIKEEQVLSMVASAGKELIDSNVFESGFSKIKLLPAAAIFGANASGKTNLLFALRTMGEIVTESASEKHRGDSLSVEPFKLDSTSSDLPTTFEADFMENGIRYQYGFSATTERIAEEWLFAFPERRAQRLFERKWEGGKYQWNLGASLKGEKKTWQKATRDNALFLSTAVQLNSQQLQPIYDWFRDKLYFPTEWDWESMFSSFSREGESKEKVLKFLKEADLGIDDLFIKKEPVGVEKIPDNLRKRLSESLKDYETPKVKTIHKIASGELVEFDLEKESAGTQKMLALAAPFLDSLDKGYIVCIDELNDNLHPLLVKFLVRQFNNKRTNPHNAQLIFTTHETSMLNQEVLRRDQVWFCEKDKNHATRVYPLSDFRPRKGVTNLEFAYLSGRYGALPYVAEPQA